MIFAGFGWEVISIDGHDRAAIRRALIKARSSSRPVLIIGQTVMAQGTATMENDHETHGAPLPNEERAATKAKFGFPKDQDFYVPQDALDHFRRRQNELRVEVGQWQQNFDKLSSDAEWKKKYSENFGSDNWSNLPAVEWPVDKAVATRNAFGDVLKSWAQAIPKLMGGSADLEPSNMTGPYAKAVGDFQRNNRLGRNLAFGVREFPMSAIANGMALHGGVIPFDATFLSFADYSRPALRLGAIQRCRVLHEFSHDSFYLGEDGPTHQPVEHVMSLRLIPNFYVMRPADAYETQVMMRCALNLQAPSAICVSRQKLPILSVANRQDAERGAYLVHGSLKDQTVIFATGSEVSLAVEVAKKLGDTKVVSIPCWEIFDEQDPSYRDQIVDWSCPRRISIEAGATLGWQRFTGERGLNIGLDHFGDSAPMEQLAEAYGFTSGQVEARIRAFFKL
jgi:transketolase